MLVLPPFLGGTQKNEHLGMMNALRLRKLCTYQNLPDISIAVCFKMMHIFLTFECEINMMTYSWL